MRLYIVVIGVTFCLVNWLFFGSGHYHLSYLEKKSNKFKLVSLYFNLLMISVLLCLYVVGLYSKHLEVTNIMIIMFGVQSGGTIVYILTLDVIGINIKNKKIYDNIRWTGAYRLQRLLF